jgi:hypothetical protein
MPLVKVRMIMNSLINVYANDISDLILELLQRLMKSRVRNVEWRAAPSPIVQQCHVVAKKSVDSCVKLDGAVVTRKASR